MRQLATIVLLFSCGCADGQSPVQPTPTLPPTAGDEATSQLFSLTGAVSDTAGRPLSGASIEVTTGQGAGTATIKDERGRFRLPETFAGAITVKASKEGYLPETAMLPPNRPLPPLGPGEVRHWDWQFRIQPDGPSANLAGVSTLTVTTHSSCTNLPDEARSRTYTATITPGYRSTTFVGTLKDAQIVMLPLWAPHLEIGVASDFANVSFSIVEQLNDATYLAIEGGAAASLGPSGMTAPFNAQFLRCRNQPTRSPGDYWWCGGDVQGEECAIGDNQLTLVRR
jgi:protocatechuate 3,4-dioxygenase beta subunit